MPRSYNNNVIYDQDGVVIRTIPAIHLEGSVSFILEWKGMKVAFSGDTLANQWWMEHARGADLAIHESFLFLLDFLHFMQNYKFFQFFLGLWTSMICLPLMFLISSP